MASYEHQASLHVLGDGFRIHVLFVIICYGFMDDNVVYLTRNSVVKTLGYLSIK